MTEPRTFLDGRVILHHGDNREVLKGMADNSIDSIVTDPPYHLHSGNQAIDWKSFDPNGSKRPNIGETNKRGRGHKTGFMNKQWDGGDIAFQPELWAEVLRVLKPGAGCYAFGGDRTVHRLACAMEDAGFEIQGHMIWCTGQGFPKNRNISKDLDDIRCLCSAVSTGGYNPMRPLRNGEIASTSLDQRGKPEHLLQPIMPGKSSYTTPSSLLREHEGAAAEGQEIRARKPSMEGRGDLSESPRQLREREICEMPAGVYIDGEDGWLCNGASVSNGEVVPTPANANGMRASRGSQSTEQYGEEFGAVAGQSESQECRAWSFCDRCGKPMVPDGLGTALKPAAEFIVRARKPISESSIAANVLRWGTGAINIGACRIPTNGENTAGRSKAGTFGLVNDDGWEPQIGLVTGGDQRGRWPANLLHDNSEEVLACFPETGSPKSERTGKRGGSSWHGQESLGSPDEVGTWPADEGGSAARFFASFPQDEEPCAKRLLYHAKADASDRCGSRHPTVKPIALIQELVRLITPKNGVCLDLFAGTGTTAEACFREGFRSILIEREAEYIKDIERRMSLVMEGHVIRAHTSMKARGRPVDNGPLFANEAAE